MTFWSGQSRTHCAREHDGRSGRAYSSGQPGGSSPGGGKGSLARGGQDASRCQEEFATTLGGIRTAGTAHSVHEQPSPRHVRRPAYTHAIAFTSPTAGSRPPDTQRRVKEQPTEHAHCQPGAQEVLLSLALGRGRAEPVVNALLGDPQPWADRERPGCKHDPDGAGLSMVLDDQRRNDSTATYGASRKKLTATIFCARPSACSETVRVPVRPPNGTSL